MLLTITNLFGSERAIEKRTERRRRGRGALLLQLQQHDQYDERGHVQPEIARGKAKQIDQFIAGVAAEIDDRTDGDYMA